MYNDSFTVVGAGIGGLTMALILRQLGCRVEVYESAPEIRPVGAGIVMANNAMQVFEKAGIRHLIEKAGNKVSAMYITDEKLVPLSVVDLAGYEKKYGVYNVAVHRADVQNILASELGFENISLSKRLVSVDKREKNMLLAFEDGMVKESRILLGADGIRSVVRERLFPPSRLRNSRQICWRGVCRVSVPEEYYDRAYEIWGQGKRFGFVKINEREIYWYAVLNQGLAGIPDWQDRFRDFHPIVRQIIHDTPPERIFKSEILDLNPVRQWQNGNACLIGDAAHAATPNMGQGACQAVEDAYTIGRLLERGLPVEEVFRSYEKIRMPKAHTIVRRSRMIGKVSQWENKMLIKVRNTLMRNMPASAMNRQFDSIFDLNYV